ncbi:MAG: serine/threonine protein kinase [Planctomycetes bacterium]|nr:serine/threonine protein kinase [Planctomycetota bacterium]
MRCPAPGCGHVNPRRAARCVVCGTLLPAVPDGDVPAGAGGAASAWQGSGAADRGYELCEELGRGALGVVHRVRNRRTQTEQALKRVHCASPEIEQRFLRELKALAAVEHENLAPILDWGRDAEGPWYVMPLSRGGTLQERIDRFGPLEPAALRELGRGLAAALSRAHAHGVLHRDVKPSNVLLSERGQPRLADFGLANGEASAADVGMTRIAMGTAHYAAPELLDGRSADSRADVYGLGVTLYYAATGLTPLAMREERIPPPWRPVLTRCVALDPGRRFQTVDEVLAAIERIPAPEVVAAQPAGSRPGAESAADRHAAAARRALAEGRLDDAEAEALRALAEVPGHRGARAVQDEVASTRARAEDLRRRAQVADRQLDLEEAIRLWRELSGLLPADAEVRERIGRQQALLRQRDVRRRARALARGLAQGRIEGVWEEAVALRQLDPRSEKLRTLLRRAEAARRQRILVAQSALRSAFDSGQLERAETEFATLETLHATADEVGTARRQLESLRRRCERAHARRQLVLVVSVALAAALIGAVIVGLMM